LNQKLKPVQIEPKSTVRIEPQVIKPVKNQKFYPDQNIQKLKPDIIEPDIIEPHSYISNF